MAYTNSPMVIYTNLTANHSGLRGHSIDRITPHCIVGQWTAKKGCDFFATERHDASCNYVCGIDGIGLCVEEKNRSWCSSSRENDNRAVTIECASDLSEPYAFRDDVYNRLIVLCADICERNGKRKLLWLGSREKTDAYTPKADEMILSVHRWYQPDKSCPGNWLMARMDDLAAKVTAKLSGDTPEPAPEPTPKPAGNTCEVKATMPIRSYDTWNDNFWVHIAQEILIHAGKSIEHGADGYLGAKTQAALTAFQKEKGIPTTGKLDGPTWGKLLSIDGGET